MKDNRGIYYYPYPANNRVKMYVRDNNGVIEFRLHNEDDPKLYEEHGWITYEIAKQAAAMYEGKGLRNPLKLYDFEAAEYALANQKT